MTEISRRPSPVGSPITPDPVDEARKRLSEDLRRIESRVEPGEHWRDIRTVLDALDAAERERDSAKAYEGVLQKLLDKARRKRDEALAVIEQAKGIATKTHSMSWLEDLVDIARTLSAAPADALRERDAENVTPEGIEVKPGQRWRSLDERDQGRTVTVESVADGKARVNSGVTRSTIPIRRMRRMSTGWELVKEQGR